MSNDIHLDRTPYYLETSGLNLLADHLLPDQFDAISKIKDQVKIELYLSVVSLWEVLLNSDASRREQLIFWGQFNCAPFLLKSPTEIVFNYIKLGCPLSDKRVFWENPYTELSIGNNWANIHKKMDRTLVFDQEDLKKRSKVVRDLSKILKKDIDNICDIRGVASSFLNDFMNKSINSILVDVDPSSKDIKLFKIAIIITMLVMCVGIELDNSVVRDYWAEKNIENLMDRLDFLLHEHPFLLKRGPILEMAKMMEIQTTEGMQSNRGLIHDCFHSVYCYYAANFITSDNHFKELRDQNKHHAFNGIIMGEELEMLWVKVVETYSSLPA